MPTSAQSIQGKGLLGRAGGWWRGNLEPEERRRVVDELALRWSWRWTRSFAVLITLSVIVATMGLSANSAAVVIGAMLIAPLMTPVLGVAASLAMTLRRQIMISLAKVAVATLWSVVLAYLLTKVLPGTALSAEVQARTQPDVRDLVVALAAGTAGAYATVRRNVSAALPGVAVAVALVPPLATVGITLEAGKTELAAGAALLYATNLAAIVFAGVMVFIATGFVPARHVTNRAVQLLAAVGATAILVAAIAVPLYGRWARTLESARHELTARTAVARWLDGTDLTYDVDVSSKRILVSLKGVDTPPPDGPLQQTLQQDLGIGNVVVQWNRTERVTTTTSSAPTDDDRLLAAVEPVVRQWLADQRDSSDYELQGVVLVVGVVRIDLAGTGSQPSADGLVGRLTASLGAAPPVRIVWTQRRTIVPGSTVPPAQLVEETAQAVVQRWAVSQGFVAQSVTYAHGRVSVSVAGPAEPIIDPLLSSLGSAIGRDVPVDVYFMVRRQLSTTSPAGTEGQVPVPSTTVPGSATPPPATTGTGG